MRCILLDDELPGLAYLKMLCQQTDGLEVVKAFNDPQKLLDEIPLLDFELLISDIEMPGIQGLELARLLQDKMVIFTTAYKEHAADAFEIDAVDYLTKPVRMERLQQAVDKAIARRDKPARSFALFNTDKGKAPVYFDRIALVSTSGSDSRDKDLLLLDGTRVLLKNISFDQLAATLPEAAFCRVSKKDVVSLAAVRSFVHHEISLSVSVDGRAVTVNLGETYKTEFLSKFVK